MALRSGTSFWQAIDSPPMATADLPDDIRCEVVVVGGGITGALVADRLVKEGIDTVLIDRRDVGTGSTAASTGLLQYEVDNHLADLIAKIGEANAVHAYRRGLTAVDEIEQLTSELGDDCGFVRRSTIYFASHWWHARRLRREFDCRRSHGFNVELLDHRRLAAISSIRSPLAIRSHGDAQIDPFRLTQTLLRRATRSGLRAFSRVELVKADETADGVVVHTARGNISARRLVFATGYESHKDLENPPASFHSTYAVVSEPIHDFTGWPDGSLIWETARPYFYARQTADGRAMIGGGDTLFANDHERDGFVERKVQALQKRFEQLFPAIPFEPAYAWAGTFGESKDGLAYIGQPDGRKNVYFAVGYGGNGITYSMIAAKLIVDLYRGRKNPDAEIFRFGR